MQIVITNNRTDPYHMEGRGLHFGVGASKTITDATEDDLKRLLDKTGVADAGIAVAVTVQRGDGVGVILTQAANANVTGGGTTGPVSVTAKTAIGGFPCASYEFVYRVTQDAVGRTNAGTATIATATVGTLLAGSGTHTLVVRGSALGVFTATLTDAADEAVYLVGEKLATSGGNVSSDIDSVTFSA